jgi:hypothetical protein
MPTRSRLLFVISTSLLSFSLFQRHQVKETWLAVCVWRQSNYMLVKEVTRVCSIWSCGFFYEKSTYVTTIGEAVGTDTCFLSLSILLIFSQLFQHVFELKVAFWNLICLLTDFTELHFGISFFPMHFAWLRNFVSETELLGYIYLFCWIINSMLCSFFGGTIFFYTYI